MITSYPKPPKTKKSRHISNRRPPEGSTCRLCGSVRGLCYHEVFAGSANRRVSQLNGFQEIVCDDCHKIVQYNAAIAYRLKQEHQRRYEEDHTREEFIVLIGKSYL